MKKLKIREINIFNLNLILSFLYIVNDNIKYNDSFINCIWCAIIICIKKPNIKAIILIIKIFDKFKFWDSKRNIIKSALSLINGVLKKQIKVSKIVWII